MTARPIEIIFLGTGCSTNVPHIHCLINREEPCETCRDALGEDSPNRRLSTSLLVRVEQDDGTVSNIVIDASKTFYQAALRWFPYYGIKTVDAVVITHSHFDAIGGLDDLRAWTNFLKVRIPIYARKQDMEIISNVFFYLVKPQARVSGGVIADLDFIELADDSPFTVEGLTMTPLPVGHGENYVANGYRFGDVSYISDASSVPPATSDLISGSEILVLDALRPTVTYGSHMTLEQAMQCSAELDTKRTLYTGMCHDLEHEATNRVIANSRLSRANDQLAYDGMRLRL